MATEGLPERTLRALQRLLGDDGLRLDDETRERCAADRSSAEPARPAAVLLPATSEAVAAAVAICADAGVPVVARGAGTGKAGGCVPRPGDDGRAPVVCSLERLVGVERLSIADQTVDVLAGTITAALRDEVAAAGAFYPPDPASLDECTIGGNVATNAGGPLCVRYGVTGDFVLGLDVVLADGRAVRTGRRSIKGVAGYDLTSLLVGSEGTLAIVTRATLRVLPAPQAVRTAWVRFTDPIRACEGIVALRAAGVLARALELLDTTALGAAAGDGVGAALLLELDGEPAGVDEAMARAERTLAPRALDWRAADDADARAALWERRRATSDAIKAPFAHHLSEDVAVPTGALPALLTRLAALQAAADGITVAAYGHAGDGNLHVNLLYDDASLRPQVIALSEAVFRAAVELGGTITGEHGVGLLKRPYLGWEQGDALIALQRAVKDALDPAGILNPGKLLP